MLRFIVGLVRAGSGLGRDREGADADEGTELVADLVGELVGAGAHHRERAEVQDVDAVRPSIKIKI